MKILIIEDSEDKVASIEQCLLSEIEHSQLDLVKTRDLASARRYIICQRFDLIIFDVFLPISEHNSTTPEDVSAELIEEFSKSQNYLTESIVITQFDFDEIGCSDLFNRYGITVVSYDRGAADWSDSLITKVRKLQANPNYKFLVYCALVKERDAYQRTTANVGDLKIIHGFDCQEIEISGYSGLCITPPRMGLVNMGIQASRSIEIFRPEVVAMSGICAGVEGETELLDLIVPERCWEWQTGKIIENEFRQEPYFTSIDNQLFLELRQFTCKDGIREKLADELEYFESKAFDFRMGPMSSGSMVIASEDVMKGIDEQHRKMCALEMEMYSMYEAANQSLLKPLFFGAKSVVDFGNSMKHSEHHITASILSARFVVEFLTEKLPHLDSTREL